MALFLFYDVGNSVPLLLYLEVVLVVVFEQPRSIWEHDAILLCGIVRPPSKLLRTRVGCAYVEPSAARKRDLNAAFVNTVTNIWVA